MGVMAASVCPGHPPALASLTPPPYAEANEEGTSDHPLWMGVPPAEAPSFRRKPESRGALNHGPPVPAGHPPLTSLRSLAPPYALRRGRTSPTSPRGRARHCKKTVRDVRLAIAIVSPALHLASRSHAAGVVLTCTDVHELPGWRRRPPLFVFPSTSPRRFRASRKCEKHQRLSS